MQFNFPLTPKQLCCALFASLVFIFPVRTIAQENPSTQGKELYDQIKTFSLNGGSAQVKELVLTRDRVQMAFNGNFYFTGPIAGHVTGAVFVGEGRLTAAVPPSEFEKDNLKRLLGAESVESDFKTAVLRFSDDTFERLGQSINANNPADPQA